MWENKFIDFPKSSMSPTFAIDDLWEGAQNHWTLWLHQTTTQLSKNDIIGNLGKKQKLLKMSW